jgi:hypothetical protein
MVEVTPFVSVSAITRPTASEARATYQQASQFSSCLGSEWSGTTGPTTETYQTTYPDHREIPDDRHRRFSLDHPPHRNVVAVLEFNTASDGDASGTAGTPDRFVTDLNKLLDEARSS